MTNIYLDRIKKKYGWTGGKYSSLLKEVIQKNQLIISEKVAKLSHSNYTKIVDKLERRHKKKGTFFKLQIPNIYDILPKREAFIVKAADQGRLLSDRLRRELSKNLRDVLTTEGMIDRYGKINAKAEKHFEKIIHETFANYTKVDPKFGIPTNVHSIAVTEIRTLTNSIRNEFAGQFQTLNNGVATIRKKWKHNPNLSKEPRYETHGIMDGRPAIEYNDYFDVPNNVTGGFDKMAYPHDPSAPPEQIINCHCECEYEVSLLPKKISKDMVFKDKRKIEIGEIVKRPDGSFWKKTGTYSYAKVKEDEVSEDKKSSDEDKKSDEYKKFVDDEKIEDEAIELFIHDDEIRKRVIEAAIEAEELAGAKGPISFTVAEIDELMIDYWHNELDDDIKDSYLATANSRLRHKIDEESKEEEKKKSDVKSDSDISSGLISKLKDSGEWSESVIMGKTDFDSLGLSVPSVFEHIYGKELGSGISYDDMFHILEHTTGISPMPEGITPGERRLIALYKSNPTSRICKISDPSKRMSEPMRDHVDFGKRDYWSEAFNKKVNEVLDNNTQILHDDKIIDYILKDENKIYEIKKYSGSGTDPRKFMKNTIDEINNTIENNPITYRFHLEDVVKYWPNDLRTKNLHETRRGHGSIDIDCRSGWERKIINFSDFSTGTTGYSAEKLKEFDKSELPSYAMMGIPGAFRLDAGVHYGESTLVLKDEVKNRCTFTLGNSSAQSGAFTRGSAGRLFESDRDIMFGSNLTNKRNSIDHPKTYIEVQIWGQVDLMKDVEKMVVSGRDWSVLTKEQKSTFKALANKCGFNIVKNDGTIIHESGGFDKVIIEEDIPKYKGKAKREIVHSSTEADGVGSIVKMTDTEGVITYKKKTSKFTYMACDEHGEPLRKKSKAVGGTAIGDIEERSDGSKWIRTSKFTYKRIS